jgi:hypothetical protein
MGEMISVKSERLYSVNAGTGKDDTRRLLGVSFETCHLIYSLVASPCLAGKQRK